MLFGRTKIIGKLTTESDWRVGTVKDFHAEVHHTDRVLQLLSFTGKAFVASEAELFRIAGYSDKAVKVKFTKDPSVDDVSTSSIVVPYSVHLSVDKKVGPSDFPDSCGHLWASAISLTKYGHKQPIRVRVPGKDATYSAPIASCTVGTSKEQVPLYQIRTAAFKNFVLACGAIVLSY